MQSRGKRRAAVEMRMRSTRQARDNDRRGTKKKELAGLATQAGKNQKVRASLCEQQRRESR